MWHQTDWGCSEQGKEGLAQVDYMICPKSILFRVNMSVSEPTWRFVLRV